MNIHLPSKFSLILILMGVFTIKGYSQFSMNLPTLNAGDSIISFHTAMDPNSNYCQLNLFPHTPEPEDVILCA